MSNLDNSASILPDYVDTEGSKKEGNMKKTEFLNASTAFTTDSVLAAAQQQPGAATNLDSYKRTMTNVTKWFADQNGAMQRALKSASADSSDYSSVFNAKKAEVAELRKKVEAEREIDGIRQEQVKSLDTREAANYHTSWMGLDRPLKGESLTGLLVAAGLFLLLALIGFFYAYKLRSSSFTPDIGSFFRGGFRLLRKGRYSF